jgi:hypothetical protein
LWSLIGSLVRLTTLAPRANHAQVGSLYKNEGPTWAVFLYNAVNMNTEYEAKFINIDLADVRRRLQAVGAVLEQPMRLMRRSIIETLPLKCKAGPHLGRRGLW